jgi:hypothetical protein
MATLSARLHPIWRGGTHGYAYSVIFNGELIVERSHDPEHDAARALLAKGITGKLTMLDGKTGKPRTIIDIERASRWRTQDGRGALRRQRYAESGRYASHSRGSDVANRGVA